MIITASKARTIANYSLTGKANIPKKQIRQLRKIEAAIIRASKQGKLFIEFYNSMYNCVLEVLEKNGYKVIDRCTYKCLRYVISWKEPK